MLANMPRRRGALIVFEGVDRSGKSTQTALLTQNLSSHQIPSILRRFPDRTSTTGALISSYLSSTSEPELSDEAIHLLFSANRWEAVKELEDALLNGTTVIVDRYAYSGVAYTAAKGLDLNWCKGPDKGLLTPDLVIYMEIPIEVAATRGGFGGERYEKIEFQEKVRGCFKQLKEQDPTWRVIDADRPVEEIQKDIVGTVLEVIERVKEMPIGHDLWSK
ncbi:thymidylate kinase [Spizellomyces punctatus DAOM BR117]|uniref:Thymidylate kinase n=1 Tax=Spizellomyces punctatus (strain DAOM BR117) TaxID=645134 RepID=A0A0L0H7G7_SPIPD|nr:thymidylate kinase [Spizellomyces punctatus DAOM BR117]KNC97162.1 thymidylate kinase [Spizellomyces punctatus DAOM BR117]|eukprot:XP_016605202.1 thymidylate kinase [Spizellomyces punctatus DAOM BR117]